MIDYYFRMFRCKPKDYTSPLKKDNNPKLDTSEKLDEYEIRIYKYFIGSLQWNISLGRKDIGTAVMTLSGFCSNPRRGHLERTK